MGNGYNHHIHHQNLHHQFHQKNTFLPMLCSRPSIKEVTLPKWAESRSASFSDDPLSPKIGCMGQVKRNNKIIGFPSSNHHKLNFSTKDTSNTTPVKYFKLKKFFSSKNLTANATAAAVSTATTTICRRREVIMNGASGPKINGGNYENSVSINLVDLDPPLPVIKRVQKAEDKDDAENLWKRRSGGGALKNLQLQQIHIPRHHYEPTTV